MDKHQMISIGALLGAIIMCSLVIVYFVASAFNDTHALLLVILNGVIVMFGIISIIRELSPH